MALFESGSSGKRETLPGSVQHVPPGSPNRTRKPLSFLSTNFIRRGSSKKCNDDDNSVTQLKHEITELQSHIEILDKEDARDDEQFIDLVVGREENLKEINRKLLHIQAGLVDIEGERCHLVAKSKQLEQEKQTLLEQLGNREKEIETLQKRCLAAEERSKEYAGLRSTNQQLSALALELKTELDNRHNENWKLHELKTKLQQSQSAREELLEKLQSLQRDHDGVCDSLMKCLASVEKLTNDKMEWEAECRRLQQHNELLLEQQRLDHIQATNELRKELKAREKKVHDLDRLLQDKIMSIQRLRKQLSNLEASQAHTIHQVTTEYERKLHDVREELNQKVSVVNEIERILQDVNKCHDHELCTVKDEMVELQAKLKEKSAEIEALRNDVSTHMQELMAATSELQKVQEDSKLLDSLFQDVETLEHERNNLAESLHERDTAIAELSAEMLKLEIEKALAGQDSQKLQALTLMKETAEHENESLQARLLEVTGACEHLEGEIQRINTCNDEKVARIRTEYDAAICEMQFKLQRAEALARTDKYIHQDALTARDKTIASMGEKMQSIKEMYQNELISLQQEVQRASSALMMKDDELRGFQVSKLSHKDETIDSLKREISRMTAESHANTMKASAKVESLEGQVQLLKSKSCDLEDRAAERALDYQVEVESMSKSVSNLSKEKEVLQSVVLEQNRLLDEFQSKSKRSEVQADTKISQLEDHVRQLQATVSDLESRCVSGSREHAMEVESMARTITELESENESSRMSIEHQEHMMQHANTQLKLQQTAFDSELARNEQQLEKHKSRVVDMEKEAMAVSRDHNAVVVQMNKTVSDLHRQIHFLQTTNADQKKMLENATMKINEKDLISEKKFACLLEQIQEIQSTSNDLDAAKSQDYQVTINKMAKTISDLKREQDFTKISLVDTERKLNEEKSLRKLESKRYEALVLSETSLKKECMLLRFTVEETRSERDKLVLELERENGHRDSEQEESLRNELAAAEKNLVSHENQMMTLEEALQDRTSVLDEMLARNKDLEAKIERSECDYRVMQDQSSMLQVRLLDKEDELKRLQVEWQQKEDDYLGEIHSERNRREIIEVDLATARLRLETVRIESRDLSELDKENQSLKDKIRRQDAYMQRKIEQERAVRDRIIQGSAMKTPARIARGSVRKSAPASTATRSTVPESECLDLELDSLLAD